MQHPQALPTTPQGSPASAPTCTQTRAQGRRTLRVRPAAPPAVLGLPACGALPQRQARLAAGMTLPHEADVLHEGSRFQGLGFRAWQAHQMA